MKKGLILFCLTLILTAAGVVCAQPASAASFDTEVRKSVAVASTCFELTKGGELPVGYGTCFFVGKKNSKVEYLVTNHHVVEDFLKHGGGEETDELVQNGVTVKGKWKVRVYFDSSDYEEAYIVDYDDKKDIALLKLDKPTDKRTALPLCSPTDDMVGSNVYAVGYPDLSENNFADSTTSWGMEDVSVTSGTISRMMTTAGTGVRRIQTDTVIQHGNSGGPLVNKNGSAVGIDVAVYNSTDKDTLYSETSYYAVNIDELLPMLKAHDVAYVMEGNGPGIIWIVIAVIAVIVVISVVVILVVIIKKSTAGDTNARSKKQKRDTVKKPSVRSMAVQHGGACFPLDGGQILIGRDTTACVVVFRPDTPGISSRHCSLEYDESTGDFLLTDLRSTYGTFLANGQKLTPGTPFHLQTGQQFYLGDQANMFSVEMQDK